MTHLVELENVSAESLAEEAKRIQTEVKETSDWIMSALSQVDKIESAAPVVRQAQKWVKYAENLQQGIQRCLGHEDSACRRASWLALYHHYFSADLRSGREVTALLTNLVERGYLVALDGEVGPLRAYGRAYDFPTDSMMENKERAEAKRRFIDFTARSWQEQKQRQTELAQNLLSQGEMAWRQLLAGEEGKFSCQIPPRQTAGGRWLRGGVLLVEVLNGKIYPLRAVGGFARIIQEVKEEGTYLLVDSLGWENAPKVQTLPAETEAQIRLLWWLLKRGIATEAEREKVDVYRTSLSAKATISATEFLVEGKPGVCMVEFPGTWQVKDGKKIKGTIPNLFFLVERKKTNDGATIRILEAPPHLAEFLAPCLGTEFPEQGPKFDGCGQPLRAVLQAVYGRFAKANHLNDN